MPRSFSERIITRLYCDSDRIVYKAVRMPRREYLKHFKRDASGTYAGTAPQHEWDTWELEQTFGQYQDMRLGSLALDLEYVLN